MLLVMCFPKPHQEHVMDITGFFEVVWFSVRVYRTLVIELLLLLGIGLSFLWARGEEVDRFIFTYVNSHLPRSPHFDHAMHLIGQLGTLWMGMLWMGALFLIDYRNVAV